MPGSVDTTGRERASVHLLSARTDAPVAATASTRIDAARPRLAASVRSSHHTVSSTVWPSAGRRTAGRCTTRRPPCTRAPRRRRRRRSRRRPGCGRPRRGGPGPRAGARARPAQPARRPRGARPKRSRRPSRRPRRARGRRRFRSRGSRSCETQNEEKSAAPSSASTLSATPGCRLPPRAGGRPRPKWVVSLSKRPGSAVGRLSRTLFIASQRAPTRGRPHHVPVWKSVAGAIYEIAGGAAGVLGHAHAMANILLQTTIGDVPDDWTLGRSLSSPTSWHALATR